MSHVTVAGAVASHTDSLTCAAQVGSTVHDPPAIGSRFYGISLFWVYVDHVSDRCKLALGCVIAKEWAVLPMDHMLLCVPALV